MAHETPPHTFAEKGTRPLGCEEWQELLVDALDGTLSTSDSAAFKLHARDCSACAQLLEETRRGSEWLGYLHHAPEAPGDLVDKILARTSGAAPGLPVLTTGVAEVEGQPWLGRSVAALQRHGVESRLLMTLAMAFFSHRLHAQPHRRSSGAAAALGSLTVGPGHQRQPPVLHHLRAPGALLREPSLRL